MLSGLPKSRYVLLYPEVGLELSDFISLPLHQRRILKLVAGHTHVGIERFVGNRVRYLTTIREPLARLRSQFIHCLKWSGTTIKAEGEVFPLIDAFNEGLLPEFDNYIVRALTGMGPGERPLGAIRSDDAELALLNIDTMFGLAGRLEDIQADVDRMAGLIGCRPGALNRLNTAEDGFREEFRAELDRIDWERVRERHLPAIQLHAELTRRWDAEAARPARGARRRVRTAGKVV